MSKKTRRRALAHALDALYAELPQVVCQGKCAEACSSITLTVGEADRLHQADPQRRAIRTVNRRCIYLTPSERCSQYAIRPLICRAWGVLERLSCPHGCAPDRWLTDYEFVQLGVRLERIAGALCESTAEGLGVLTRGFAGLAAGMRSPEMMPPELVEYYARLTRGARAVHGGRVLVVRPSTDQTAPEWIHPNKVRD